MSNRFLDAESSYYNTQFIHNDLNGLNIESNSEMKIKVIGHVDTFTLKTIHENYEIISKNLKVYPTINVYSRDYKFEGGFGGFYYYDKNHINIADHYYIVSMLAHEMRHAYQYIYFPNLFFNTSYSSVREYLACDIERDARGYALDYCTIREYWEEVRECQKIEQDYELVIQNKMTASTVGLDEGYFIKKPYGSTLTTRNYQSNERALNYSEKKVKQNSILNKQLHPFIKATLITCASILGLGFVLLGLFSIIILLAAMVPD
ncbi:hypothetical protein [Priestia megaterium]|uniref:hypothetical protein n=1 Tax=Priestia megaterium TaxID=1404 RepID=UPI003241E9F2